MQKHGQSWKGGFSVSEKYFSLESIKQDIEWLQNTGSQELLLREVMERFEYGAIPAADVRPVVRGRWVKQSQDPLDGSFYCSACHEAIDIATGEETPIDRGLFFCPGCGADMRGGWEENEAD